MKSILHKIYLITVTVFISSILTSCASVSRGVAEAFLERRTIDTRQCVIVGKPFNGMQAALARENNQPHTHSAKVLMVHGIGLHIPGYATRFRENLAHSLGLNVLDKNIKSIQLEDLHLAKSNEGFRNLGTLLIYRYSDTTNTKELFFYELTWSSITQADKTLLDFDNTDIGDLRRAQVNHLLKIFMNGSIPDLLIYMGNKNAFINASVSQSLCWMFYGNWQDLPNSGKQSCSTEMIEQHNNINDHEFFFVTHSLGSRITLDAINFFTNNYVHNNQSESHPKFVETLKHKEIEVFMLANQLPLLQMGHLNPSNTNKIDAYCSLNAPRDDDRILGKLRIIAFSDPNDLLSYPIPHRYAEEHIDSRLCPEVANVFINIASVNSILGSADFADPISAHRGYQDDDRVIAIIANGIARQYMPSILQNRCSWTEIK